jgi:hypothetical protein
MDGHERILPVKSARWVCSVFMTDKKNKNKNKKNKILLSMSANVGGSALKSKASSNGSEDQLIVQSHFPVASIVRTTYLA